jgi:NTP pyrophosphatase (non-canonical NTP hydrolase)
MEKSVLKIAELMQHKLDKNKHKECAIMNPEGKGRMWSDCDVRWLLMRLREEADEIEKALNENESPVEIAKECADVCNFAMMIADNAGGLDDNPKNPS